MHRIEMHSDRPSQSELPPDTLRHVQKSLKKQANRYRKKLKCCQQKFSEKAVHDFRVEARRLFSTIDLLVGFLDPRLVRKVHHAIKQHLDTFDELRDTQVQLLAIGRMRRAFPAARPFHAELLERERRLLGQTRKRIRRLKTRRLAKLLAQCRRQVKTQRKEGNPETTSRLLLRALDKAFRRTWKLRAQIDPRRTRTIHRTRIAFKKFRYMLEALASHLPARRPELPAQMRHYQTMMGDIQDAQVLLTRLDKSLRKTDFAPASAAQLREELLRRRQWRIRVYLDAADQLRQFRP